MQLATLSLILAEAGKAAPDQPRIVGGYLIEESTSFPYHVQVGLFNQTTQQAFSLFGGALITMR